METEAAERWMEELLRENVLHGTSEVCLSEEFKRTQVGIRQSVERQTDQTARAGSEERTADSEDLDRILTSTDNIHIASYAAALLEHTDAFDHETAITIATALRRLDDESSWEDLPREFIPLFEDEIQSFIQQNETCIVYFWKDESNSCDTVRHDLDHFTEQGLFDEIALGSVYTPNCTGKIHAEYNIQLVPTLLFCKNSSIYSRLVGASYPKAIENEMEYLIQ